MFDIYVRKSDKSKLVLINVLFLTVVRKFLSTQLFKQRILKYVISKPKNKSNRITWELFKNQLSA